MAEQNHIKNNINNGIKNWSQIDYLFASDLYKNINNFVKTERKTKTIFPKTKDIFRAFELSSFENTKVIILGQDPYHNENQANGLSFAVNNGEKIPPSLKNIFTEITSDIELTPQNSNLEYLAKQGVLLLNSVLTVEKNSPNSHALIGWQDFTDEVISALNEQKQNLVFLLWGANAIKKQKLIDTDKHLVLTSVHPSPLSAYRGFFGCKHFSKTNDYLKNKNLEQINWSDCEV
jgi:uracil-DNA glycosylase